MASDDVQLLTVWASYYGLRAEVALSAKGIAYSISHQDPYDRTPLLLQSNPVHKKIPVLLDHGKAVCESMIIVEYVDEAFPSPDGNDLLPKDPYCRATARFWADFVDKKISDNLVRLWKTTGEEHKATQVEVKEHLKTLEEAFETLAKERPYFGGPKLGFVDVILSPLVAWYDAFETFGNFQFEFEKLPRLSGWMRAMRESPCGHLLPEPHKVTALMQKRIDAGVLGRK